MINTSESARDIRDAVNAALNADAATSRVAEFSGTATTLVKQCVTPSVTLEMIEMTKEAAKRLVYYLDAAEEAVKKAEPHLR